MISLLLLEQITILIISDYVGIPVPLIFASDNLQCHGWILTRSAWRIESAIPIMARAIYTLDIADTINSELWIKILYGIFFDSLIFFLSVIIM